MDKKIKTQLPRYTYKRVDHKTGNKHSSFAPFRHMKTQKSVQLQGAKMDGNYVV